MYADKLLGTNVVPQEIFEMRECVAFSCTLSSSDRRLLLETAWYGGKASECRFCSHLDPHVHVHQTRSAFLLTLGKLH